MPSNVSICIRFDLLYDEFLAVKSLCLCFSGHNQRLEFLGDTVLQIVASEYLFKHFPEHHEGHLSVSFAEHFNSCLLLEAIFPSYSNTIRALQFELREHAKIFSACSTDLIPQSRFH